jgi:YidC/Oxa1 family membrane protein insertase
MESRALIAFVLSVAILVGYQMLLAQRGPVPAERQATLDSPPAAPGRLAETAPGLGAAVPPRVNEPLAARETGQRVRGATDHFELEVDSIGGRLRSYQLKQYRATSEADSPLLDFVVPGPVLPLGLYWTRPDGTIESDQDIEYELDVRENPEKDGFSVEMHGIGARGERVTKRIAGEGGTYVLAFEAEIEADHETSLGVAWARPVNEAAGQFSAMEGPVAFVDDHLKANAAAGLEEPETFSGTVEWAGYADHYFLAAFLPDQPVPLRFSAVAAHGTAEAQLWPAGPGSKVSYGLYVGPKKLTELRAVGHKLEESVDLGWFAFVARPLLELMLLLNRVTGNYGWSIILLTVGVRLVFYPVNKRQALAMKAMQKIQPELKRIQEKFKDDREKLNRELMEVYRRHKVNPLAGCLPMLLQLPVFLGLYNALMQSIELRHAPFLGWITDLSQPDRLGAMAIPFVQPAGVPVLTLFMGASMLVQQKMMPAAGDPTQQRMMMFMPVIFTVMFINFPSGLVLYWFASNVMSIAQQYLTNRASN